MVVSVNIFDWDLGVQIDLVKQPVKSNSVGSGHASHLWTHFDHDFIVLENIHLRLSLRRMCVCGHIIHTIQLFNLLSSLGVLGLGFGMESCTCFLDAIMVVFDNVVG